MAYDFYIGKFLNGEGLDTALARGVDPVIKSAVTQFMRINRAFAVGGHQLHGGARWKSLAPSTIKRKGHGMILIDKGIMRASIGFKVIQAELLQFIVDVGSTDPKSNFHQSGGANLPQRIVVDITPSDRKEMALDFGTWAEMALNGEFRKRLGEPGSPFMEAA